MTRRLRICPSPRRALTFSPACAPPPNGAAPCGRVWGHAGWAAQGADTLGFTRAAQRGRPGGLRGHTAVRDTRPPRPPRRPAQVGVAAWGASPRARPAPPAECARWRERVAWRAGRPATSPLNCREGHFSRARLRLSTPRLEQCERARHPCALCANTAETRNAHARTGRRAGSVTGSRSARSRSGNVPRGRGCQGQGGGFPRGEAGRRGPPLCGWCVQAHEGACPQPMTAWAPQASHSGV